MDALANKDLENFSPRDLRDALSTFATGVTIVTAQDAESNPIGMTASSFNSVSMDPPLILWSVTKTALSASAFKAAPHFAIHVLATDQTDLANRFARSGEDKFSGAEYRLDDNDVPCIEGCATRFDCRSWATYEGGDHWIIVGEVVAIERAKKEGLVFGGGAYATASPLTVLANTTANETTGESEIESLLFYHLSRAYHQMGHQFHEAVRNNGLTLAEWRILANLYGNTCVSHENLTARTFLDPQSLSDALASLSDEGLCTLSANGDTALATGTDAGSARVKKLFELGGEIEASALGELNSTDRDQLIAQLRMIVSNTESLSSE